MADFSSVYASQNQGYQTVWQAAQAALNNVNTSSLWSAAPVTYTPTTVYDPGAITPQVNKVSFQDILNTFGIIQSLNANIAQIQKITLPPLPDMPSFQMKNTVQWQDTFATQIQNSLSGYLTTMGIPDATYTNAIFKEDYDRNLQTLNDEFDLADAKTGARGFTYPNDYGNSLKIEAQAKYQFDKMQLSRTISKTIVEWARQNYQFAMQHGIQFEQAQMDFTYKYCTGLVQVYKDAVISILERSKAQIELALAPLEALIKSAGISLEYVKTQAEIDKANIALTQSRSELQIKEALQKYSADSTRVTTELGYQLEQVRAVAQQAATIANATSVSVVGYVKG